MPQIVTSIHMEHGGQDFAHWDFVQLIQNGGITQQYYDAIEDALISIIQGILKSEGVEKMELVIFGDNREYLENESPEINLRHRIEDFECLYEGGTMKDLTDLTDFFRLALRDGIGYGVSDRKGHFVAFLYDSWVHVGHNNATTIGVPKLFEGVLILDDVSELANTTDNYESLL